jgi:hypothetical protein
LPFGAELVDAPWITEIFDVISGFAYVLDSQARVAHRYRIPANGKAVKVELTQEPAVQTAVAGEKLRADVPASRAVEPVQTPKVATLGPADLPVGEKLGSRSWDGGLRVEGTRYVNGGAGESGTSEVWVSPELQVTVLTKLLDAQNNESVVRLRDLKRGEPDGKMFDVPAGYRVQDENGQFQIISGFEQR